MRSGGPTSVSNSLSSQRRCWITQHPSSCSASRPASPSPNGPGPAGGDGRRRSRDQLLEGPPGVVP
eukprot:3210308-Alexandrium_andersonii.AAC.1